MALSPAERIQLGLDIPDDEFNAGYANGGALMPRGFDPATPYTPNPRLQLAATLKEGERVTGPKIRSMVNELLACNMENANKALQQLFAVNPKEALKIYLELGEFALPKLKAVAVAVDDRTGENPRALGFAELQKMLQGD